MPLPAGTKLGLHEQLFSANRTAWSSSTLVIRATEAFRAMHSSPSARSEYIAR
jgi:hypothetical protein